MARVTLIVRLDDGYHEVHREDDDVRIAVRNCLFSVAEHVDRLETIAEAVRLACRPRSSRTQRREGL